MMLRLNLQHMLPPPSYITSRKLSLLTGDDEAVQAKADEAYRQALLVLTNLLPAMENQVMILYFLYPD